MGDTEAEARSRHAGMIELVPIEHEPARLAGRLAVSPTA